MSSTTKQSLTTKKKRELISAKYDLNHKPVNYNDLSYNNKIYLLAIFRVLTDEAFEVIIPLNSIKHDKCLSPTKAMDLDVLNCLYTKGIILVDPSSKIEAFNFKNNKITNDFDSEEVNWIVNIGTEGERQPLYESYRTTYNDIVNNIYFDENTQIYSFTYTLAYNEALIYLQYRCEELGFVYGAGDRTLIFIYQILNNFSVSEIYNFIDQAVEEDYFYYSNIKMNKEHFGHSIPERMLKMSEKTKINKKVLTKNSRNDSIPRSTLSSIYYELIIEKDDEGFTESPKVFWSETLESFYTKE